MKIYDRIKMCLSNLFRRKVRTLLTVTGVIVGTCSIVVMISLGVGMKVSQEAALAQMGDLTQIQVYSYGNNPDTPVMNDEMVAQMQAMDGVLVATPLYRPRNLNASLFAGKGDRYEMELWNVTGVYPEALPLLGYQIKEGAYTIDSNKPLSVVMGENTAYNFRDTKKKRDNMVWPEMLDANGQPVPPYVDVMKDKIVLRTKSEDDNGRVRYYGGGAMANADGGSSSGDDKDKVEVKQLENVINVTGILKTDFSKGYETYDGIFMNLNEVRKLEDDYRKANNIKIDPKEKEQGYDNVIVKTEDITRVPEVEQKIKDLGYETYSMEAIRGPMEESSKQQQLILGGLGAISLFVAALGITNTMIMSIYERTREIGVMKVLGCFVGDIRSVFLMEAGLIGFMGGIFGIGISYAISMGLNYMATRGFSLGTFGGDMMGGMMMGGMGGEEQVAAQISIIPPWLILLAICFATLIGLVSGFYPANRAVKISALEAIKHE